ncbi:unnamed protein product, partial [Rotaria sordida]
EQMNMLNATQVAYLLNLLLNNQQSKINYDYIKQLDINYDMSKYSNCEIRFQFKSSWPEMMPRVQTFFDERKKYMNLITVKQIEIRLNSQN